MIIKSRKKMQLGGKGEALGPAETLEKMKRRDKRAGGINA